MSPAIDGPDRAECARPVTGVAGPDQPWRRAAGWMA